MLRLAATACLLANVGGGLLLAVTRGGVLGLMGVPPPVPFYGDLLAVFLTASGLGFIPTVTGAPGQRLYLWIFGVGVKLVAGSLMAGLWAGGLAGWLIGQQALADVAHAGLVLAGLLGERR
jgi:hypothetical protein